MLVATSHEPVNPHRPSLTNPKLLPKIAANNKGEQAHWINQLKEVVFKANPGNLQFTVEGGSERGEFIYVGQVNQVSIGYITGRLEPGDVIIEVQGQKIGGYTQEDTVGWIEHCCRNDNPCVINTVGSHSGFTKRDLRSYLNTRFQKGSVDHELQTIIRDNLYLRTVPVTTRAPRPNEIPGVDYTFISLEEFERLESSGQLLESGVYEGHHYGTPRPCDRSERRQVHEVTSSSSSSAAAAVPSRPFAVRVAGKHPASEGKRRRNRSSVEAMTTKAIDRSSADIQGNAHPPFGGDYGGAINNSEDMSFPHRPLSPSQLGPLPENWERATTEQGEPYFIDHNTGTSHWLDPRLQRVQKKELTECDDNELPFGWERIDDPAYGTYFIDHVNRRTQYENPVHEAKRLAHPSHADTQQLSGWSNTSGVNTSTDGSYMNYQYPDPAMMSGSGDNSSSNAPLYRHNGGISARGNGGFSQYDSGHPTRPGDGLTMNEGGHIANSYRAENGSERAFFTRDPDQLRGERIETVLEKSSRGLGFTIVGGDDGDTEEFLQIKSVVPNGPAWIDGKLCTGDVLVRLNQQCVLGYTHQDMVCMFQTIPVGQRVTLEVCRGYPLPFDPDDPNTEIVTTVAVSSQDSAGSIAPNHLQQPYQWPEGQLSANNGPTSSPAPSGTLDGNNSSSVAGSKSLPNLSQSAVLPPPVEQPPTAPKPRFLSVPIVKGDTGFGFTIADSAYGQRVKKILDRQRCTELLEGDILVEINSVHVKSLAHADVVQVLKDCPIDLPATVTVQRGGTHSPTKPLPSSRNPPGEDPLPPRRQLSHSSMSVAGQFRSKTPTAELMASRPREQLPSRPKTPLVDTRRPHETVMSFLPQPEASPSSSAADTAQFLEMSVTLLRHEAGFGFRIVGGTEEGSQVSIGHIVPGGAADLDGRLQSGDEIMYVDGLLVLGASHHHVVQMMSQAGSNARVQLGIRRRVMTPSTSVVAPFSPVSYEVSVSRREDEGFGFVIISSAQQRGGSAIGRILPGSPAERCGSLKVGDRILAVNGVAIGGLSHGEIVSLIKDSGRTVVLTVGSSTPPQQLRQQNDDGSSTTSLLHRADEVSTADANGQLGFDGEFHAIELSRGYRGFGFSIRGGREFHNMPLFVLRIAEGGAAAVDGRLRIGDQIVEINSMSTSGMTHAEAIDMIKQGDSSIRLLIRRGGKLPQAMLEQMSSLSMDGTLRSVSSLGQPVSQEQPAAPGRLLSQSQQQTEAAFYPGYHSQHLANNPSVSSQVAAGGASRHHTDRPPAGLPYSHPYPNPTSYDINHLHHHPESGPVYQQHVMMAPVGQSSPIAAQPQHWGM